MSAESWSLDRNRVIEASAGTGKTHTITTLVCRLVVEQGVEVKRLLVTTFTEAAAAELRDRIRSRMAALARAMRAVADGQLQDSTHSDALIRTWSATPSLLAERRERLERAIAEFDQAAVTTIHGFCRRMLVELPFELGTDIGREVMTDAHAHRQAVLADAWSRAEASLGADELMAVCTRVTPAVATKLVSSVLANANLPLWPGDAGVATNLATAMDNVQSELRSLDLTTPASWQRSNAVVGTSLTRLAAVSPIAPTSERFSTVCDLLEKIAEYPRENVSVVKEHKARMGELHALLDHLGVMHRQLQHVLGTLLAGFRLGLSTAARESSSARKLRERAMTFDDMLHDVRRALQSSSAAVLCQTMQARFGAVLVDEFQDTDRVQCEIFQQLFGGGDSRIFYIGDPKQSIYLFRGADIDAYLEATTPPCFDGERAELDTSFRTDRPLLDAVQALVECTPGGTLGGAAGGMPAVAVPRLQARHSEARMKDMRGRPLSGLRILHTGSDEPDEETGEVVLAADAVFARVAEAIRQELEAGSIIPANGVDRAVRPEDIAVLCRSNSHLDKMQRALRAKGIPSVARSRQTVWQSEEAAALASLLRAVATPSRLGILRAAAATEIAGLGSKDVRAIGTTDGTSVTEQFSSWLLSRSQELHAHGPVHCVRGMLDEACMTSPEQESARLRVLARAGGERAVTDLQHLAELLGAWWRNGTRSADELCARLEAERARTRGGSEQPQELVQRVESDGSAVQLSTVHAAKGLEWPIVWLPMYSVGKWDVSADTDRAFPVVVDGARVLAVAGTERDAAAARHAEETRREGFRLLYVGLTRAKHRCNVVWASATSQANASSPLAALLHGHDAADADDAEARAQVALSNPPRMVADLEALRARACADGLNGAVELVELPLANARRWQGRTSSQTLAIARVLNTPVPVAARTTSFTGLTRGAHATDGLGGAADGIALRVRGDDAEQGESAALEVVSDVPLLSRQVLPAGPVYGDLVHRILEEGLRHAADESFIQIVQRHGANEVFWDGLAIAQGLRSVTQQPLLPSGGRRGVDVGGATLASLASANMRCEMSYLLPAGGDAQQAGHAVSIDRIVRALRRGGDVAVRYCEYARQLSAPALRGHLVGVIDLLCQHRGKWYVLDYKTNALGSEPEAFEQARLDDAMCSNHYVLQYHLYALAAHRWLKARMRGYDYDEHFGGALYLFLRGMGATRAPGSAVFADRPTRAVMEALDETFAGGIP